MMDKERPKLTGEVHSRLQSVEVADAFATRTQDGPYFWVLTTDHF